MKIRLLLTTALLASGAAGATDVGVSVSVGDSGFYGRIDVGTMPRPPPVVYTQPVVVEPAPVVVERPPVYLRVPPGTRSTGRSTATSTTRAVSASISCRRAGTTSTTPPPARAGA